MPGTPGTTSRMTSPATDLPAPVPELGPSTSALAARHSPRALLAACATAVLAGRERDALDTFEAATFGVDRSAPTPLDLTAAPTHLAAPTTPDEAALDAFERATFGLSR